MQNHTVTVLLRHADVFEGRELDAPLELPY